MTLKVIFSNDIIGCDFRRITSLAGLVALDGVFFLEVDVPDVDDYEGMANIIEYEFTIKYPDKRYSYYTIKMPQVA